MGMDIDPGGVARNPFVAGVVGSLVGLKFAPGATVGERITNVLAGAVCAGYVAPGVTEWLHITSHTVHALVAFGIGLFGLSLAAAIWQGVRDVKLGEVITGWISRKG